MVKHGFYLRGNDKMVSDAELLDMTDNEITILMNTNSVVEYNRIKAHRIQELLATVYKDGCPAIPKSQYDPDMNQRVIYLLRALELSQYVVDRFSWSGLTNDLAISPCSL